MLVPVNSLSIEIADATPIAEPFRALFIWIDGCEKIAERRVAVCTVACIVAGRGYEVKSSISGHTPL